MGKEEEPWKVRNIHVSYMSGAISSPFWGFKCPYSWQTLKHCLLCTMGYSCEYFRGPQCQRHPACTSAAWTLSLLDKKWACALSPCVWQSTTKESFHPSGTASWVKNLPYVWSLSHFQGTHIYSSFTFLSHCTVVRGKPRRPHCEVVQVWDRSKRHLLRNPGSTFDAIFVLPRWGRRPLHSCMGERVTPNSLTTPHRLGSLDTDSERQIFMEEVHWGMQARVMPLKKWRARMVCEEAEQFHQPSAATPGTSESGWALDADCPHRGINSGKAPLSVGGNAESQGPEVPAAGELSGSVLRGGLGQGTLNECQRQRGAYFTSCSRKENL